MENILNFFTTHFDNCVWLAVMLVALIPTLESKIAIPLAMNTAIWGSSALPAWQAFTFAFLGSIIPSALIIFLTRKIKSKTCGFITNRMTERYYAKASTIDNKQNNLKKLALLSAFVALPLPLTGVWTGSFVAGFTHLKLIPSLLAISIGSLISCLVVTLICTLFSNSISIILFASFLLIIIYLSVDILLTIIKQARKK